MDIKTTEYAIATNEIVCEQITEQAIDAEFLMPDYCPAIAQIVKCKIDTRIHSRSIQGKSVQIEGVANITTFYADADNELCSWQHIVPFLKSVELPSEIPDAACAIQTKMGYVNCKAIGERKCAVHAAVGLSLRVTRQQKAQILSNIQGDKIEQDCQMVSGLHLVDKTEKYVLAEDNIELDTAQPTIEKILCTQTRAVVQGCKVVGNKVVAKGDVYTEIFYATDTKGETEKICYTMPFSQIMDVNGATEDCLCDATVEVCSEEYKPRTNLTGEQRSVSAQVKLLLSVCVYSNAPMQVVKDAYSIQNACNVERKKIIFETLLCSVNEHFLCKKTLEFTQNSLAQISDVWCDAQCNNVYFEDGQFKIDGAVNACILGRESDGRVSFIERSIDFSYSCKADYTAESFRCVPNISVTAADCLLLGQDRAELKVDIFINALAFAQQEHTFVTDIAVTEELIQKEDVSAILCFAKKGMRVWDIAKQYRTCRKYIMQFNSVDEILQEDTMLLIPAQ